MNEDKLDCLIIALEANTRMVEKLIEIDHTILHVLIDGMGEEPEEDPSLTLNG